MADAAELKILSYRLPTVSLSRSDIDLIKSDLGRLIEKRPQLFDGMSVVIEPAFDMTEAFLTQLTVFFAEHGIRIVATSKRDQGALTFSDCRHQPDMVVNRRLRSGERLYAKGNLVVIGTVSSGAELLAEGSIHVYGELRGRALAGVQGDRTASIYTLSMQAELVSIAGVYRLGEKINAPYKGSSCCVRLENSKLTFSALPLAEHH